MTTIILASKLISIKTAESELDKIQNLKNWVMKEKIQVIRSLRKLMKTQKSFKTCRLCLRFAENNVFDDEGEFNIAENIKSILNIEVLQDDGKPQYICEECECIIRKTVELKQVAELTQWRLEQEFEIETTCNNDIEDLNYCETDTVIEQKNLNIKPKLRKTQRIYNNERQHEPHVKKQQKCKQGSYICETCGLKLKTLWRLKTHRLTHTSDFKYSCSHCPYRARTSYSVRIHERAHTGDRPYSCAQCRATFASASNLASHRRSHLPPAYTCDICQKGFKFKEPLLNHIASQHRSAKPFYCTTCGKAFATRKLLRRHERRMHDRPKMRIGATPSYIKTQEEITSDL